MRSTGNIYNPVPVATPEDGTREEGDSVKAEAIALACDRRFHQCFAFSGDFGEDGKEWLRVSYADAGRPGEPGDGVTKPVVLYASGMFGGRYQALSWHKATASADVRLIAVDRPGIGGTTPVPLRHRVHTWLQIVPALLEHLDVKHVSLVCHSAGLIYMMNTLLHLRHLLHPKRPYAAFLGPWIPPEQSGRWTMQVTSVLPASLIGKWDKLASFAHRYMQPLGMISSSISQAAIGGTKPKTDREQRLEAAVQEITTRYLFKEDVSGASDEALLCLGKGPGVWDGVATTLDKIALHEHEASNSQGEVSEHSKLQLEVFYAENDEMIGKGGQDYLSSRLQKHHEHGVIITEEHVVPGTDHNDILWPGFAAWPKVLEHVRIV